MPRLDVIPFPLTLPRALSPRLKQNTPLLTPIRRRRRQTASHRRQSPFLNIGFYEDESGLAEVHVYGAWSVGTDGREEVLGFQAVRDVVEFFTVAGEEDRAGAGTVSDAYNVALDVGGAVGGGCEGLVVAAGAEGCVG